MARLSTTCFLFLLFFAHTPTLLAQAFWEAVYVNNALSESTIPSVNYVEFDSEGTMYIAETDRINQLIHVRKRVDGDFILLGGGVPRNMGDQPWFDFALGPNGEVYLGTSGVIHRYDAQSDAWESFELESYYGGLTFLSDGGLYFIHSVTNPDDPFRYDISVASLDGESVTVVAPLFTEFNLLTFRNARLNRIIERDATVYVSLRRQSSNSVHVLRGNFADGMEVLEQSALMPEFGGHNSTVYCGPSDGSVAVSPSGEISLLLSGTSAGFKRYIDEEDAWEDVSTDGLPEGTLSINHLRYNAEGVLHLVGHFGNGLGFAFRQTGDAWEHIGPLHVGESEWHNYTVAPYMAFDAEQDLHFIHGMGTLANGVGALHVRRLAVEGTQSAAAFSENKLITAYPNPACDRIRLSLPEHLPAELYLRFYDSSGRLVTQVPLSRNTAEADLSKLPSGLWLGVLTDLTGARIGSLKIVRE